MRDSYFARPLQEFVDTVLDVMQYQPESVMAPESKLHNLSWEIELLLLDNRLPEREWRQAAAKPLGELLQILQLQHLDKLQTPNGSKVLLDWDEAQTLVAELAY